MPTMTDPTPINRELEPRIVDELVVLDLDRTLINSSVVQQLVLSSLGHHGVSADRIEEAMAYAEAQTGNSFFLFDYIEEHFSGDILEVIVKDIMNNDDLLEDWPDLLCLGADKLIDALQEQGTPCMILTYGEDNYQQFKIDLFRKLVASTSDELPAIITGTSNKSEWVASEWFNDDHELGEIPASVMGEPLLVGIVTVVDDKVGNLQTSDERVVGVLVDNNTDPAPGVVSTAELANAAVSGIHLREIASLYEGHTDKNKVHSINTSMSNDEHEKWAS